ncbi:MAG: hypothetical protein LBD49_03710, partial [Oscillospiraceae bacterium]|nr:hypothetical protein [Oscillospiraceae bacterium]
VAGLTAGTEYKISFTAKAGADTSKTTASEATFMAVSGEFTRSGNNGTYTVAYFDANGAVALTASSSSSTTYYYVAKASDLYKIFDAVYTPNKDVTTTGTATAASLFHVTIGAAATGDVIKLQGDPGTGAKTINVGYPNNADNSFFPPVEIPFQQLGTSDASGTAYQSVNIVVNNGVYLDIDAGTAEQNLPTGLSGSGNFTNGTLTVASGAKVRDSAWYGFPLGAGSAIVVLEGGYLAVGEGDRNGNSTSDVYDGWIIAPEDTSNAWIQLGSMGTEPGGGTRIEIVNTTTGIAPVLLYGKATISGYVNLFYDVFVSAGSEIIVENGGQLVQHAAASGAAKIYGQPASTNANVPSGFASAPASKITIESGGSIDNSYLSGQSASTIFTGTSTGTSKTPISGGSAYYPDWTGNAGSAE